MVVEGRLLVIVVVVVERLVFVVVAYYKGSMIVYIAGIVRR